MKTTQSTGPELMRREILEEARRVKESILARARQEEAAILAKARQEIERFRSDRMEAAKAEAVRRAEAILATVPVEVGRMRSARGELLLQEVRDCARRTLEMRAGIDYQATIVRLAIQAISQMNGDSFRIRFCPADRLVLENDLIGSIQRGVARSTLTLQLITDATLTGNNLLIEDEPGRQVWDLGLEARLNRCWPELRRQIAAHLPALEKGAF